MPYVHVLSVWVRWYISDFLKSYKTIYKEWPILFLRHYHLVVLFELQNEVEEKLFQRWWLFLTSFFFFFFGLLHWAKYLGGRKTLSQILGNKEVEFNLFFLRRGIFILKDFPTYNFIVFFSSIPLPSPKPWVSLEANKLFSKLGNIHRVSWHLKSYRQMDVGTGHQFRSRPGQ